MILSRIYLRHQRFIRYLVTGGWNTIFGFLVYTALYHLFGARVHYLLLLIPANILAIANAFLCYRYFVFKSRGNILREYLRCNVVYGGMLLVNAALMYALVEWLGLVPVLANACCIVMATVISFFAHRNFSFSRAPGEAGRAGPGRRNT